MRVAVISYSQTSVFQRLILAGVKDYAQQVALEVVTQILDEDAPPLNLDLVDGVLIVANAFSDEKLRSLHETGKPISLVSHQVPDVLIPALRFNNAQGIELLMDHLYRACGRRRIVFIGGIAEQLDAQQRQAAFEREVMRYHLDIPNDFYLRGEFEPEIAASVLSDLIETGQEFDAVLAADYRMAATAVEVLSAAGRRVPEDVCVVGFGDADEAEAAGITTVAANVQELGYRAARQLMHQMGGLHILGVTTLSVNLVQRQSSREIETP